MEKKIIAVAAGHEITNEEFEGYIRRLPQEQQMYMSNPQARGQLLDQIMDQYLYAAYGADEKMDETDSFKRMMETFRMELLSQTAVSTLLQNVSVTDEEIQAYFDAHQAEFVKGAEASAKHILVDSKEKCDSIAEEIKSGAKTFEDAAKEYSTCPSGQKGGDLGSFGRGQMVPEFEQAAFNAEIGSVTGPVQTQFGYHLIKVEKRSEGEAQSFEEVKTRIGKTLISQKQNKIYEEKKAELKAKYGAEVK